MVATAERQKTDGTTERGESSVASAFDVLARRPTLHLVVEPPPSPSGRRRRVQPAAEIRALAVWPRLDRRILYRCRGEPGCLARAIARHRTTLSVEHVIRILTGAEE
ncbi:MAG: hypothetical protein M3P84_07170 [Chloroflexota bacterium]|nr:hypothetical protein [Chloroflexota bacterium]